MTPSTLVSNEESGYIYHKRPGASINKLYNNGKTYIIL